MRTSRRRNAIVTAVGITLAVVGLVAAAFAVVEELNTLLARPQPANSLSPLYPALVAAMCLAASTLLRRLRRRHTTE